MFRNLICFYSKWINQRKARVLYWQFLNTALSSFSLEVNQWELKGVECLQLFVDVGQIRAGWNRIHPRIKSPQMVFSQCTVSAHTRIIKNGGGRIRGHRKKLMCVKCSHLSILLFLEWMENSWRNHNACPKWLYTRSGKSPGMVFDSEHTLFFLISHQIGIAHCY